MVRGYAQGRSWRPIMGRLLAWLNNFSTFVFINHANILIGDGRGNSGRPATGGRAAQQLLLQSPDGARARPRLTIRMAPSRRDGLYEQSANAAEINAGWQATIKRLEAPQKGRR